MSDVPPSKFFKFKEERCWAGSRPVVGFAAKEIVGQQIYAFALGVLYAYWLEKSKSIVAPIVGHNVSDVSEYAIVFAWVAFG